MTEPQAQYLEVVKVLAVDVDKRELTALALPYGEEMARTHWGTGARRQSFEKGAAVLRDNATLFYGHDHLNFGTPVGRLASVDDTDEGPVVTARFAATAKADEIYALCKPDEDGRAVLEGCSIGYYEVAGRHDAENDVYVHTEIDVFEMSVTHDPQYRSASVRSVLGHQQQHPNTPSQEADQNMPETLTAEHVDQLGTQLETLTSSVTTLERQVATLGTGGGAGGAQAEPVPYASHAAFVQGLARQDDEAYAFLDRVQELLAFDPAADGVVADLGDLMKDSWVGDRFKQIEAARTVLNFFARSPLPEKGMSIEYGVEGEDTTKVERQEDEGDLLPKGKVTFKVESAPIETYGGWGEMSIQLIKRAPINVVERFLSALTRRYALETEAIVSLRAIAAGVALTGTVLDLQTADGWTKFVIRAARQAKDTGYPLEGILVGHDVFEDVALLRTGDAPDAPYFLNRNTGSISVEGLSGEMFNLPIVPIKTGNVQKVVRAANREAIRTYEAGGAPFQLNDKDVTRLTEAYSMYGFMADVTEVPKAVIKPAA